VDTDATTNVQRWTSPPFLDEVTAWVATAARGHGVRLTGEREQPRARPWSTVVRFGSTAGDLWFKVNAAGTAHEGRLVGVLSGLEPELVPPVLAVDDDRGWSLTADAGPVLRSVAEPDRLWEAWEELLPRYAEAQLRLSSHLAALLATGIPAHTADTLPQDIRGLVAELATVPVEAGGLGEEDQDRLAELLPAYDGWCRELAGSGLPDTIQHDDLHSANICWPGPAAATARLIDWGDASVGVPLGTMLCTLNSVAHHAGCRIDDPRVVRLRDAYLEPFTVLSERSRLVEHVALTRRTGCVTRALSYRRSLLGEPVATHRELDFPVRGWLLELFEADD
jgi:hypothetical protein